MKLSGNFHLEEFLVSATAARMGRSIGRPPEEVTANLTLLCVKILQPLRDEIDRSVVIISGYRPEWLNKAVGGSPRSSHMRGEAADLIVPGKTPREVCEKIIELDLPFDQLILEFNEWVHVSYTEYPRKEVLTAKKVRYGRGFKTKYFQGLQ